MIEPLDALRRTLESLRVTECRLSHERVVFASGRASRRHANGVECAFVRVGLCPWEEREVELACAHTTARNRLASVAESMAAHHLIEPDEGRSIVERIDQLSNTIHATDWAKSELETAYALAVEANHLSETEALRARLEQLESDHTVAARELDRVLERLRRVR